MKPMQAGTPIGGVDGSRLWTPPAAGPWPVPDRPRNGRNAAHAATPPRLPAPGHLGEPVAPPTAGTASGGEGVLERSVAALEPIGDAEASAFAARFAADYLSWDEDDPSRRAQVLREYLADPATAALGWSGVGRQRAEVVLPGRTLRTPGGAVVVEVTARVVSYLRTCPHPVDAGPPAGPVEPPLSAVGPSCAPPPEAAGWRPGASHWARIAPPIRRDRTGRLVVDIGPAPDRGDG
ncbi:hypothetical protein HF526_30790 [Pseudonocardia sp. K10HN5]|uniref:SnoaL-like protein n=1 Tax=Pseudonocardia acidicola TaxID=2724939 RepID=A0ABX1SNE6_9PSEU|nr:hypothetical protein [Pseudonocardia acidicola]